MNGKRRFARCGRSWEDRAGLDNRFWWLDSLDRHRLANVLVGHQGLLELQVELFEFWVVGCLFLEFEVMLDGLIEHTVLDAPLGKMPMLTGSPFANRSGLVLVERVHGRPNHQDLFFGQGDLFAFVHDDRDGVGLRLDEPLQNRSVLKQHESIAIEIQGGVARCWIRLGQGGLRPDRQHGSCDEKISQGAGKRSSDHGMTMSLGMKNKSVSSRFRIGGSNRWIESMNWTGN